jgi:pyridoxal phosphate enzyme (YggS family)
MNFLNNFKIIKNKIENYSNKIYLIVVTKNQTFEKINQLISLGHKHFGENKVQEAKSKWREFLKNTNDVKLHFIGKLQSNKIKGIGEIFEFIHSLDNIEHAKLFSIEEGRTLKKLKYFIQVNLANETQKSGVKEENLNELLLYCKKVNLNVIGLMCIPPVSGDPSILFKRLQRLSADYSLKELSMGMSNDYNSAISYGATYVRIGSAIFNKD